MTNTPAQAPKRAPGTQRKAALLRPVPNGAGIDTRLQQREVFALVLRAEPNRRGKPYSERTIGAYLDAVDSLARWLTGVGHPDGFDTITVGQLNLYLSHYLDRHTLGGTVTKQGNLRVFLKHLAEEYDGEDLWTDPRRHRYQRQEEHPDVLPPDLIAALLKVTSGKDFADRRDHALIRVLLIGVRRQEAATLRVEDLDLTSAIKTAAVVGLKGRPSRRVPLGDRDVLALKRWLSHRSRHRRNLSPEEGPLWIADKTGRQLEGNGVYLMLRRRAAQAGYPPGAIRPHLFRHTFAHEFLAAGGTESDLMALAGWRDRSMVLRYGASMAEARALDAVARSRFSDRY